MGTPRLVRRRFLAVTGGLALPLLVRKAAATVTGADGAAARVRALLETEVSAGRVAGACVALGGAGAAPVFVSAGRIGLDSARPMAPGSICRIASMTKPLTGLAALLLIEDGVVSLDAPAAEWLPELADPAVLETAEPLRTRPAARPITLRHLLTHTAGFNPIYHDGPAADLYRRAGVEMIGPLLHPQPGDGDLPRPASLDALAARIGGLPLIDQPGTRWRYSVASDLLGLLVQRAAGRDFPAVLATRLLDPLGMTDTGFFVPATKRDRLTTAYRPVGDGLARLDGVGDTVYAAPPGLPSGGSGLVSTARDYARFCAMLAGEGRLDGRRIARPETIRTMRSALTPPGADRSSFVLGGAAWGAGVGIQTPVSAAVSGLPVGAYGWSGGYGGTTFWVDPARQTYGVLMMQRMMGDPTETLHARLHAAALPPR